MFYCYILNCFGFLRACFLPFLFCSPLSWFDNNLNCCVWTHFSFLCAYLVFPILLFLSISLHYSFKKAFPSLLAILWNSAFMWVYLSLPPLLFAFLLSSAACEASLATTLLSYVSFSLGWLWSMLPIQCEETLSLVFSGTLSATSIPLNLFTTYTV